VRSTSSLTYESYLVALIVIGGCGKPTETPSLSDVPINFVETASKASFLPPLPWTWESTVQELAANPPRNLMSEQVLEPNLVVTTVAPIASSYVYVLEGKLDSTIPAMVELHLASEYEELENAQKSRVLRTIPYFDGQFQITFHTYPTDKIIRLVVVSSVPAYLHRAVLRMVQDAQDLRMLGGFYGYAENPALDQWRRSLSLDGEVKNSLLFPGTAAALFPLAIPRHAVLHTHYAVLASNGFRSKATFLLEFIADGTKKRQLLCRAQVSAQTRAQLGRWLSLTCDLKELADKRGHLVLRTEAAEGERPLLLWGKPSLFTREKTKPNLLVITLDSLRQDRMTGADDARDTTPFLSRLASEAVFFPHFITHSSLTHASLISMLYAHENGSRFEASDGATIGKPKHLLEHLREHGYLAETLGDFADAAGLEGRMNTSQVDEGHSGDHALLEQALTLLRSRKGAQQALWLHLQGPSIQTELDDSHRYFFEEDDAHFTRVSDLSSVPIWQERVKLLPSERTRILLDYDRRLRQTDEALGRFFERAQSERLMDDTLIVLTASHGADLFAHNPYHAGAGVLFDTVLRVPLLWIEPHRPGSRVAKRVELPVGGIDLAPSILDYLGITPPKEFQGESVLPLVDGFSSLHRFQLSKQPCVSSGGIYSYRSPRHKLILNPSGCKATDPEGYAYAPGGELYDLLADPQETQNLFDREPELVLFLKRHLIDRLLETQLISKEELTLHTTLNQSMERGGHVD
jgi:arylsulfatase A-like enzyme